jgi:hypothetical protein
MVFSLFDDWDIPPEVEAELERLDETEPLPEPDDPEGDSEGDSEG